MVFVMFNGWKITNIFDAPPCELDTVEHRDDGFAIMFNGLPEYLFVERLLSPDDELLLDETRRLGYESPEDVEAALRARKELQHLIDEVYRRMQTELTEKQCTAARLRFVDGMSQQQVACAMGVHRSTAREHIETAVKKLRRSFAERPYRKEPA
jgi:RNA polymerase sigma factor (sigma-70 family)